MPENPFGESEPPESRHYKSLKTGLTIPPAYIPQSRLNRMVARYFIYMTNPHSQNHGLYGR